MELIIGRPFNNIITNQYKFEFSFMHGDADGYTEYELYKNTKCKPPWM